MVRQMSMISTAGKAMKDEYTGDEKRGGGNVERIPRSGSVSIDVTTGTRMRVGKALGTRESWRTLYEQFDIM